jgi:hypothetical protein
MIPARPHSGFQRLFQVYLSLRFRLSFRAILLHGAEIPHTPFILIANHLSWWDGFWAYHVVQNFWRKKFFVMMLEEQLKRFPFLSWLGAFSLKKEGFGIRESLSYSLSKLSEPNNVVLIFPQGRIHSMHAPDFLFEPGVQWLIAHSPHTPVVGMAFFIDYFASSKPYLDIYYETLPSGEIQAGYQAFYQRSLLTQQELWKTRNT